MKHWKPLLTISYQQTRKARKKIYGIPPLFMQETKSKIYEMIDVNIFVNEINLLYYFQDYKPCSFRRNGNLADIQAALSKMRIYCTGITGNNLKIN